MQFSRYLSYQFHCLAYVYAMKKVTSKKELYKIIEHLFSSCFFEGILLLYIGQYRITVNKFITLTKIISQPTILKQTKP